MQFSAIVRLYHFIYFSKIIWMLNKSNSILWNNSKKNESHILNIYPSFLGVMMSSFVVLRRLQKGLSPQFWLRPCVLRFRIMLKMKIWIGWNECLKNFLLIKTFSQKKKRISSRSGWKSFRWMEWSKTSCIICTTF